MPHLSVEHWEESEEQIKSDDIREVESKIPLVGKWDGELLGFFKIRNVPECNYSLADEANGIERNPESISKDNLKLGNTVYDHES